jgi:cell wall-associated NlpC family hydrolase
MLTEKDLRLADILLSTGDAKVSSVIRHGTGSRFSHTALYAGNGEIIEAIGEGVVRQSLTRAMRDDTLVCAYRRLRMSDAQAGQVIRYATMQIGKSYDELGAVGAGVTSGRGFVLSVFAGAILPIAALGASVALAGDLINRLNPDRTFYCSELVALAFEKAGVPLGSGAASTTPEDVASAHVLNLIGTLKGE